MNRTSHSAAVRNTVLLVVAFATLVLAPFCTAQTQVPILTGASIERLRADTQADRVTVISTAMDFSENDAAVFWPLYRKYEYERSTLDDRRVEVIKQYSAKYPDLTDSEAKAMAEKMFDCDARLADLKKKYFKKFNEVLPAVTVAKFFQLEHRIDVLMDMNVESALPPLARAQEPPPQEEQ